MSELRARWPALLSVELLAEYWSISTRAVEKMAATGKLPPPVSLPDLRRTLWRREDIDGFLAELPEVKD